VAVIVQARRDKHLNPKLLNPKPSNHEFLDEGFWVQGFRA